MTLDSFLREQALGGASGQLWVLAVSFAVGVVASAVCPCTLPMGLGVASVVGSQEVREKKSGLPIAFAFFMGIVVSIAALGALAGRLSEVLTESFGRYWAICMAIASLLAAPIAYRGPRFRVARLESFKRPGILGSFLYGCIFSLGTSAAPLLLLLTLAASQERFQGGLLIAISFGLGRGFPFLLLGVFAGLLTKFIELSLWRRTIQLVSALSLVLISAYYFRVYFLLS
jgi:cytochrome c-type biogenesis protein